MSSFLPRLTSRTSMPLSELPIKNLATSSLLPTVADNPIIWASFWVKFFSLSNATESWTPLLLPTSSCTSSITTYFTFFRCSLINFPTRSDCKVSGVEIKISGGFAACLLLSYCVVSPCLVEISISNFPAHQYNLSCKFLFSALRGVI